MEQSQRWDPPSKPVAEMIRGVSVAMLEDSTVITEVVDQAVLAAATDRLASEPALIEATRDANHANLMHWIAHNAKAPGERVPPNLSPQVLELARDIVRRGFTDTSLESYRVGQNAGLRFLIDLAFDATDDVEVLRELLDVTSRSIFTFIDDTLAGIEERIDRERDQLTRGTHAERLEVVNLILEGAPITSERAGLRIGYELNARHQAAVIWAGEEVEQGGLERAADSLARALGAERPFTVVASARSLWVWVVSSEDPRPEELAAALAATAADSAPAAIRAALGRPGAGMDGFRRSHLDALATQRLMQRMPAGLRVATYREVELVALAGRDEQLSADFVTRTLGELERAAPVLRETLRVYIREQFNTSAASRALYAHRNTVLNRLERARELLPTPLEGRGLEIGLALEIQHWLGAG